MGPLKVKDDTPQSISVIPNVPQTPISIAQPAQQTISLAPPSTATLKPIPIPPSDISVAPLPQQNLSIAPAQAPSSISIPTPSQDTQQPQPAQPQGWGLNRIGKDIVSYGKNVSDTVVNSVKNLYEGVTHNIVTGDIKLATANLTNNKQAATNARIEIIKGIQNFGGGAQMPTGNDVTRNSQGKLIISKEGLQKLAAYSTNIALGSTGGGVGDIAKQSAAEEAANVAKKIVPAPTTSNIENSIKNNTFDKIANNDIPIKQSADELNKLNIEKNNHDALKLAVDDPNRIDNLSQTAQHIQKIDDRLGELEQTQPLEKPSSSGYISTDFKGNNVNLSEKQMFDLIDEHNELSSIPLNKRTVAQATALSDIKTLLKNAKENDTDIYNQTDTPVPRIETPNIDNELERTTINRARMMDQGLPEDHPDMLNNEKRMTDLQNLKDNGTDIKPTDYNGEMQQEYTKRPDSNVSYRTQPNLEQETALKRHEQSKAMERLSSIIAANRNIDKMIELRAKELKELETGKLKSDTTYESQARNDFENKNPEIPKEELDAYDIRKDYEATIKNAVIEDNLPTEEPVKKIISDVSQENRRPDVNDPAQQTKYQPQWHADYEQPLEYRTKTAIAEAVGHYNDLEDLLNAIENKAKKLSKNDRELLSDAVNGNLIPKGKLDDPELFDELKNDIIDYMDHNLAVKRISGRMELKRNDGNTAPLYFQADKEQLDKLGVPQKDRFELSNGKVGYSPDKVEPGFDRWTSRMYQRKYNDYTDAYEKSGGILKPLNKDVIEDLKLNLKNNSIQMQSNLLRESLQAHVPEHVSLDPYATINGKDFTQLNKNKFFVSDDIKPFLNYFKESRIPIKGVGAIAIKSVEKAGNIAKGVEWLLSPYHYFNLGYGVEGLNAITGHAIQGQKEILSGLKSIIETKEGFFNHLDEYRQSGKLDQMRAMGIVIKYNTTLERYETSMLLKMADAALDNKIHVINPYSKDGIELGKVYNAAAAGRINPIIQGFNKDIQRIISIFSLAPNYLRANLTLFRDAFFPRNIAGRELPKFARGLGRDGGDGGGGGGGAGGGGGGGGKGPLISKFTPGGAARGFVIGKRALEAALAVTITTIILGRKPTKDELQQEVGLTGKDTSPNIKISGKNQKGEKQQFDLPADPLTLVFNLIKNPSQFLASRTAPIINFANQLITNKNYNNQTIQQPGQSFVDRAKYAAENSFIPMAAQGFLNVNNNINNPSIAQSFEQQLGLRLKVDPNDPQAQQNAAIAQNNQNVKNKLLNGQYPGQEGTDKNAAQALLNEFNYLHPTNLTDIYGNKIATPFDAYSGDKKYETELDTSGTSPKLGAIFYADKELATSTPNYPTNPLYKLEGTGTDFAGNQNADKALVAIEYRLNQDPAAKALLMQANGGANGWLAAYQADLGKYSQNYQANVTNYLQNLGWTQNAIDDYWTKHPSTPDPVDQLNISQASQQIVTNYQQLAQSDPVEAANYFKANKAVLNTVFDQLAVHSAAVAKQRGQPQLQGYPQASSEIQKILDSMPQGADTASKAARANLINNNAKLRQYLTDVNLWEVTNLGSQFKYVNPQFPNQTIGQNVNAESKQGQTFLKDVSNLGRYDIGKDASTGVYQIMQNGGFPSGTTVPGSGTRRIKPIVYRAKKAKSIKVRLKKAPKSRPVRLAKQRSIKIKG